MNVLHTSAFWLTLIAVSLQTSWCLSNDTNSTSQIEAAGVVPDVLDTVPPNTVQVKYQSNVEVNQGNELTPTKVKDEPSHVSFEADSNALYTLAMIGPDAPSRADPVRGQVVHWLVINVPGNNVSQGEVLTEYRGSAPHEGTGLHRFIFVVYKQPWRLTVDGHRADKFHVRARFNFNVRDFAQQYSLGQPVAANFFQAQYDAHVDVARAEVKDCP